MLVTLPEAKEYLRVDAEDEDTLILGFIGAAQEICMDVARVLEEYGIWPCKKGRRQGGREGAYRTGGGCGH